MPIDDRHDLALRAVQQMAREFDARLKTDFDEQFFGQGGNLLLGTEYAKSPRIFLGLNPGGDSGPFIVEPACANFWDRPGEYRYWTNCHTFVKGAEGLHDWISLAAAAFCCPWRTTNYPELCSLNSRTSGRLFEYSGRLVQQMWQDHQRLANNSLVTIVAAGRTSLYLLSRPEFLDFDLNRSQFYHEGRGIFQWAEIHVEGAMIFQVPHFSRANSPDRLRECASWLAQRLADQSGGALLA